MVSSSSFFPLAVSLAGRSDGATPLEYAAADNQIEIMRLLIAKGANIEATNVDGETVLHSASFQGHLAAVKFLLSRRASITAQNVCGDTPLDVARYEKHEAVIAALEAADPELVREKAERQAAAAAEADKHVVVARARNPRARAEEHAARLAKWRGAIQHVEEVRGFAGDTRLDGDPSIHAARS